MLFNKIYVICPAHIQTGGPELLHQLVYVLTNLNQNAYIVYTGITDRTYKIINDYTCYVHDYLLPTEIIDETNNIIIVPETNIYIASNYIKCKKAIWWLSVDNFFLTYYSIQSSLKYKSLNSKWVILKDIIHNISKYANSQNKINMSDFNANDAYHVKMERLSRSTPIPVTKGKSTDYWFYERARGQYLVELNRQPTAAAKKEFKSRCPKNRCISKTVAAKCVMAYRGYPYIVSKGLETSFVYFSDMVSKGEFPEPSEQSYIDMISKVILFNSCDEIIKNLKFGGFKAQQDYYTVALIGKYHSGLINPQEIWNNQTINAETARVIEELAYFVWEHFQNPTVPGVNIGQWCKKEDCWELLQSRYEAKMEKREN